MEIAEKLARLKTAEGLPKWVIGLFEEVANDAQRHIEIHLAQAEKAHCVLAQKHQITLAENHRLTIKSNALTLELAYYKRMRYGIKNEALTAEQRDLFVETFDADIAAIECELANKLERDIPTQSTQSGIKKPRLGAGRQALPAHLPRVEHRHEPESCNCVTCGQDLVRIGEDITEKLDVEPAKFFVHRHIRGKYACRTCETMTAAPVPAAIIDGGMASAGLLTWLAVSKYADHLPLYRLEQIAQRANVTLARSTLAAWTGQLGFALQPLVDALQDLQWQRKVLHGDETPIKQLDPGKGKTKKAYLWAYRTNDLDDGPPIIIFDYQTSRAGIHAQTYLQGWQGHLLVDDYSGYKKLYEKDASDQANIIELGCWAHARRKFFELHAANQNTLAAEALRIIAKLYAVEQEAQAMTIQERQAWRAEHAIPQLKYFKQWLDEQRLKLAPGSSTAKAFDYTLRRWPALQRYANTGNLPIDNNAVENCIRPIAIGRKNGVVQKQPFCCYKDERK